MTPLLENILQQSIALENARKFHTGEGRSALLAAAEALRARKRVVLAGMGASLFAGAGFASWNAAEASELLYASDAEIDRDDALILISRSGESVEITKLLKYALERDIFTLGVTNVPGSTLANQASQAILTASPPDQFAAIQTYIATVATLVLLESALCHQFGAAIDELAQTVETLARWLPAVVDSRLTWDEFLKNSGKPVYLLGRGSNLASVSEGVLLMHEIGKEPMLGMSVAQFRHGPVEVVDSKFRAVVLGTEWQTTNLDRSLTKDIKAMGGDARWLGPPSRDSGVSLLCPWPENAPARFLRIFEIVPLQCLAYRTAELKGLTPGEFRWAPQVTLSESGFTAPV